MATTLSSSETAAAERQTRALTIVEAVREALREEMERDERVVVLGEDIGPLGGVFRATDGLLAQFGPERVIDTPMMELGIAGLAVGMAMRGLRPVAEIQFADFIHAAADHIISDAARIRFRTNGDYDCPLVVRTAYGGGFRGGPYHSQSVEAYYAHVPGLRVVAASFPADAKGLLTAAIRHPDPVLFLEHKRTYRSIRGDVPEGEHVLPLDRASIVRPGRHVTVVAWGWVLHEALAAAEDLAGEGIELEVIDPRTLNPLDADTLLESARRTGRLCVVHEDTRTMGLGAEIAALAAERALDDLRAPVERIAMPDVAGIPASGPMEDFLIPDRARIAARLRALARVDRAARANGVTPAPPSYSPVSQPGSLVSPTGSLVSPTGSLVSQPGSLVSPSGSLVSQPGSLVSPTGSLVSQTYPLVSPSGSLVSQSAWAETVTAASQQIPQASSVVEIDLSAAERRLDDDAETWRQRGLEPSFTPLLAEALVAALREVPQANAAFEAEARAIRRYPAIHLGMSVSSSDGSGARYGVISDADTRNALGLATEIQAIRDRGSDNPDALSDATVTLADFGAASAALFAVPLVLPGQSVAVRAGAVDQRLLSRERGFAVAPTVYVCASIDHRALDGADAGALLGAMKLHLEASG